ncbi:hypothetical protein SAMN05519103_06002 [Rhizobiales bacterium GAS113]|nr:hypothetical protein SAMN05519103_06002 [Rhizobiales bacterium GAS113]
MAKMHSFAVTGPSRMTALDPERPFGMRKKNGHSAIPDVIQFPECPGCNMLCI